MITTDKLKSLKEVLQCSITEIDDLLRTRPVDKLFKSSKDYQTALKACSLAPQEYYKLRLFDTEITLNYSFRDMKFYFHIETLKYEFLRKISFTDFVSHYKLCPTGFQKDNFIIPKESEFESIVKMFYELCRIFLGFYTDENALFIYQ